MKKIVSIDKQKAEVCKIFFPSVCSGNVSSHTCQGDGQQDRDRESKIPPTVSKDEVHDHLRNLNIHKCKLSGEMHPKVLRELAEAAVKPFLTFEKSWQSGEVPRD